MLWDIIPLLVLLGLSACFSASETAFFNLTAHQRNQLAASRPALARFVQDLLRKPEQLLVTLLLANLAVNVAFLADTSVLVIDLSRHVPNAAAVALGFVPLVLLISFGEVLPKVVALTHAPRISLYAAPFVWALERVVSPVTRFLNAAFTRPAMRLLYPARADDDRHNVAEEELASALDASSRDGLIDRQTGRLLREVVELKSILVREVMVPRVDLRAFDLDDPRDKFIELVRETRLKRLPVFRGDLDRIVGTVEARAVLLDPAKPIAAFVKPIQFVPDVINVASLLAEFRRTGRQRAVVVDEYGGTAGLITLEDLVEEIVGDIYEPHDRPVEPLIRIGPNEYRVAGDLSIRDWAEIFGQKRLPHAVHTIAGLIAALLGRAPRSGDVVRLRNLTFTVDEVQRRRVRWGRIRREAQAGASSQSPAEAGA